MDWQAVGQTVITAAAIVGGLALIWDKFLGRIVFRPLARLVKREIDDAIREVVRAELALATAELQPNGGTSMKDDVTRLAGDVHQLAGDVVEMKRQLEMLLQGR